MTVQETIRKAIAHVPQSMTSDILKVALLRIWWAHDPDLVQILLENHDSILMQAETDGLFETACRRVSQAFAVPVLIHNRYMTIPVEITTWSNWRDLK